MPSSGLAPIVVDEVFAIVRDLRAEGYRPGSHGPGRPGCQRHAGADHPGDAARRTVRRPVLGRPTGVVRSSATDNSAPTLHHVDPWQEVGALSVVRCRRAY